jgi:L-seryl-tRNA(Ser) seleniumtransferase
MVTPEPDTTLFRRLPSIDAVLRDDRLGDLPRRALARVARRELDAVRRMLSIGGADERAEARALLEGDAGALTERIRAACAADLRPRHRRVVNATGIVLHTGLGRAPIAPAARDAMFAAAGSAVVEVDPRTGRRNEREEAVAALVVELCRGAGVDPAVVEAALVVNNNAAAVNLLLRALAEGREVVVSRGELVEIGGGFRMPDVMAMAGCRMVEVGATNRTHLRDFERALGEDTGLVMKVHTSNYRIEGFAGVPPLADLVALGRAHGVPVVEDLGSGFLVEDPIPGLEHEPRVHGSLAAGPDLLCFSGDKLLGGPQCGILVGRAALIRRIRSHPLYRAFRCDKLTLAGLEATLRIHRDGEPLREIPTLRMLAADPRELRMRAERLLTLLGDLGDRVVPSASYVGSGANPARPLPCFATVVRGDAGAVERLRAAEPLPVFARIADDEALLEARSMLCEDLDEVAAAVRGALGV